MNIIYNSVPLSLHAELGKWKSDTDFRLDFTVENRQEVTKVLAFFEQLYHNGYSHAATEVPYCEYTTGHEKRGVE
jgi:hypothetical protein